MDANNAKAQIHPPTNKIWNNSLYSSFEYVSSDHRIVTVKTWLNLRRNAERTTTIVHYDWSLHNNRNTSDKYTLSLRNEFNALQEISETLTPNDQFENFVSTHIEAAAECIPIKQRAKTRDPLRY